MIQYELKTSVDRVIISLNTQNSENLAAIEYQGSEEAIEHIRRDVERSYGLRGRRLGDETSPIDLQFAMSRNPLNMYSPKLIRGEEIFSIPAETLISQ